MSRTLAAPTLSVLTLSLLTQAAIAAPAAAQAPPEGLVWMALKDINEAGFDPEDPTNHPPLLTAPPDGMIRAVNVSDDGKPDWLMDYEKAGVGAYCGTGGCTQRLYVSTADGYARAFDEQAFTLTVGQGGVVEAWVHHLNCSPERDECRYAWVWNADAGRLVERPASDGVTILGGGGFMPTEFFDGDLPEPLADYRRQHKITCRSTADVGFETRFPDVQSIPDLNGDAVRDYVVRPPWACDEFGEPTPDPGFQVWLSTRAGSGGFVQAYESEPERYFAVDIDASPALALDRPACGRDETCAGITLRIDRSGRRLTR